MLDLREVEFVEPAGICGLAALLEALIPRCEEVGIALSGRDVPAYLERMNFFRLFGDRVQTNVDLEALEARQRHNPGTLQELVNFHDEEEIPGIINRISEILENQDYRLRERVAICSVLSEICANAAEHGASSFGAYAAVQAYHHIVSGRHGARPNERQGEEVLVAIADGGPGVRETLSRNPALAGKDHHRQRRAPPRAQDGRLRDRRNRTRRRARAGSPDLRPRRGLSLTPQRRRTHHFLQEPQELPQRPPSSPELSSASPSRAVRKTPKKKLPNEGKISSRYDVDFYRIKPYTLNI